MEDNKETTARGFFNGMKKSLPIVIGIVPSGVAFGILAKTAGLTLWESLFMSAVVFAGASQFAALNLMMIGASAADIIITTALLNARHIMMASSLSRRLAPGLGTPAKIPLFLTLTDESFSIASLQRERLIAGSFIYGLQFPLYLSWSATTLCGYLGTSVMPQTVRDSMGIAIYALFISLIIPATRKSRAALTVTLAAMALSALFKFTPGLSQINRGVAIIISAGGSALLGALLYPTAEKEGE